MSTRPPLEFEINGCWRPGDALVGAVPHPMEDACATPEGRAVVQEAIDSLLAALWNGKTPLDAGTLNLLGIGGEYWGNLERSCLLEIGQAFIDLLDGKITCTVEFTEVMPGSKPYPPRELRSSDSLMKAILLNGPSSSGKTSIAKAIQRSSPLPFIHIPLDAVVGMFDWETILDKNLARECQMAGVSNFYRALPALLSSRFPGIIDTVMMREEAYAECMSALRGIDYLFVGVHCAVGTLQSRELIRGDRRNGLAEAQHSKVHQNREYDLEVDTSTLSPEACASEILAAYHQKA